MKTIFNEGGVTVSSSQLSAAGQTYEIKKISLVGYKKVPPNFSYCVFCLLLGILLALDEGVLFAFGGCFILVGIIAALVAQPKHVVVLDMPEGQVDAVTSSDKAYVDRVIEAVQASMGSTYPVETLHRSIENEERPSFISRVVE